MILDDIVHQGNWFFRWRSYVLLITIPIAFLVLSQGEPIELRFGDGADFVYEGFCLALALVGLAIRAFTVGHAPKGTSGRNTRKQIAESLNTTGMYSLCRNPLYFGNAVIYLAASSRPKRPSSRKSLANSIRNGLNAFPCFSLGYPVGSDPPCRSRRGTLYDGSIRASLRSLSHSQP
ncbi:methyltransferase family protein [Sinorhizobium mexicanum]|uniref:methyltransferase family protein n=1 Tax=Sinorhizobium mexicanum TaxID=375549 RepID=UPI001DC57CE0|nr:hypothetical protein [Sinorhizobium mexicanum]MBP1885245.1 protein-S-isoprenylcysteine O-methyltransferase Ste14 [Sinorhizobium mexicanum]